MIRRIKEIVPGVALIAVLIAAWWVAVILTHSLIFPTPWEVVTGTWELLRNGTLWDHIGASLMRVGAGFGLAVCCALPLGLWMGWNRTAAAVLNPLVQVLRPISPLAWIPVAIVLFGVANSAAIFLPGAASWVRIIFLT